MRKGAVYSRTTTWVFRPGPVVGLAVVLVALAIVPAGGLGALFAFRGRFYFSGLRPGPDAVFHGSGGPGYGIGLRGHGRQPGGAVRRCWPSRLCLRAWRCWPPAPVSSASPASIGQPCGRPACYTADAAALLVAMALLIVLLAENARIPVDDPKTHLELTMIHEVMVLDHGGVDLAFIQYGAALKLWLFAALLAGVAMPLRTGRPLLDLAVGVAGVFVTAVVVGVIESTMARLRLLRVPQMLVVAPALSLAAFFWILR